MKKILFTGGGSAGHVVPNLAIIEDLQAKGRVDVCYMGTAGLEKELAGKSLPYYTISCPKLVRGGGFFALKNNVKIPFAFLRAVKEAKKGLRLFQPDLVFSKGGYVALPVVFAAKQLKIPCVAHESDYSLGLANKLSRRKCRVLLTSFPETANALKNGKYSGAPIRRSVLSATRRAARRTLDIPQNAKVLLVFGGGSGSVAINEAVRTHIKKLTERYFVLHLCGKGNEVQSNLANYRQMEFALDMGTPYAAADLAVCRAGAGTVFEVMARKLPAIFVPLEGATRGDQQQNAAYFERRGLCRVLPQKELDSLPQAVDSAFADEGLRSRLLESGYGAGNARIVEELFRILYE